MTFKPEILPDLNMNRPHFRLNNLQQRNSEFLLQLSLSQLYNYLNSWYTRLSVVQSIQQVQGSNTSLKSIWRQKHLHCNLHGLFHKLTKQIVKLCNICAICNFVPCCYAMLKLPTDTT